MGLQVEWHERINPQDENVHTILDWACYNNFLNTAKLLKKYGAKNKFGK